MRQLQGDPEIIPNTADDNKEAEFCFDDEPLDRILYGADLRGPSPANLFLPGRKYVREIIDACEQKRVADVIAAASKIMESGIAISAEMYLDIAGAIGVFYPHYPNPVMRYDLSPLKPLFDKIWETACGKNDMYLKGKSASLLFRCYEHCGEYEKAREVLAGLIEICRQNGDRNGEALYLNNFGFEYLLEKKWSDAVPCFEKAAGIFREINITFEAVNTRANYWMCRFELDDLKDIEGIEKELKEILATFSGCGRWYERKPLVLLARLEERRGNIDRAIELVEKAIESAGNSNTRYPEMDRAYLEELLKKRI